MNLMEGTFTNSSTPEPETLTLEKLKAMIDSLPNYGLIVPSALVETSYQMVRTKQSGEFMPGRALYWLIVPVDQAETIAAAFGARPCTDMPNSYAFDIPKPEPQKHYSILDWTAPS